MPEAPPTAAAVAALAPGGTLRAAINLSNFLLVTGTTAAGAPDGVSPDMARELARRLGADIELTSVPVAGRAGRRRRDRRLGRRQHRRRAAAGRAHRVHRGVLRDRGHLPRAAGLADQTLADVDRPGRADRLLRTRRLRPVARAEPAACRARARGRARCVVRPLRHGRTGRAGRACGRGSRPIGRGCPAPGVLDGRFTAVQQAIGTPRDRDPAGSRTWRRSWPTRRQAGWWRR